MFKYLVVLFKGFIAFMKAVYDYPMGAVVLIMLLVMITGPELINSIVRAGEAYARLA